MKTPAIIVDIDGTLADTAHRQKFLEGPKKNWPDFFGAMAFDPVNGWCRWIIHSMTDSHHILLVSGRPEDHRETTTKWLWQNDVPFQSLLMRPQGNYEPDHVVKKRIFEEIINPKYRVSFVIDDRKSVVEMWRAQGLVCLQCAPGEF